MKRFHELLYKAGFVIGTLIRSLFPHSVTERIKAEFERHQKMPEPLKTHIDPLVLTARDEFGFSYQRWIRPDSGIPNTAALFQGMAVNAFASSRKVRIDTGITPHAVAMSVRLVTLNRIMRFDTVLRLDSGDEPETVSFSLPDGEKPKWINLDRAMKCFLN